MTIELSALLGMEYAVNMVKSVHIGDGVYLQEIKINRVINELVQQVKNTGEKDYRRLVVSEELEISGRPYTHRFYISMDKVSSMESEEVGNARQLIMRAIVLSRIIKPLPIPLH